METIHTTRVPSPRVDDDIDLLRYGRFLASYSLLLAGCVIAGAAAFLALAAALPATYQATTTMAVTEPPGTTPVVLTAASAKTLFAGMLVVSETIKETGLDRDGITQQAFIDDALDVRPVPSTNLVKVSVTLRDPGKAQAAATTLGAKIVEFSKRLDREGAAKARQSMERQLTQTLAARNKAERDLLDFRTKANVEGCQSKIEALDRQGRPTASQGTELYRVCLELERLEAVYLERSRLHLELSMRYDDAMTRSATTQVEIVEPPIKPEYPVARRFPQYGTLGAIIGLAVGIVAALLINRRRLRRAAA